MSMIELSTNERKLAERIDAGVTHDLAISDRKGGVAFASMEQVMEFAKLMALSSIAVPKHLRGNPGACLAVCIQSLEWQMSPYAVANKSYSVNDRLAYEAQLIEAVILRRAPIKGRPKIEYSGDGEGRVCMIWAELRDEPGETVKYESPKFGKITPKNSPLWKSDPDQQHFYYSVRAWCRRHFPDVLLGVYARDELEDNPMPIPGETQRPKGLANKLKALAGEPEIPHDADTGEIVDAQEAAQTLRSSSEAPAQAAPAPAPAAAPKAEAPAQPQPAPVPPQYAPPLTEQVAYEKGEAARQAGFDRNSCPSKYTEGDAAAWVKGWVARNAKLAAAAKDLGAD